jgi:hypothetical protein
MFKVVSLDKRDFTIFLVLIFILFMVLSLEMLFITKDLDVFNKWYQLMIDSGSFDKSMIRNDAFNLFVNTNVTIFLSRVITPFFFIIHTYFAYTKMGINKLYVYFWGAMFVVQILVTVGPLDYMSIAFYVKIILYTIISFQIFKLKKTIDFE